MKINERIIQLKDHVFHKDKIIQDKIQLIEALNFVHGKQNEVYNNKFNQKNFKFEMLNNKYDKLNKINKEQEEKLQKFEQFYDSVKNGATDEELQNKS